MAPTFPQVGDTFGPYKITGQLGQGHAGVVFRATRKGSAVDLALKVIRPRLADAPGFRDRFLRSAAAVASLDSAHVLGVHASGTQDGCLYIATDLVPAGDLGTRL